VAICPHFEGEITSQKITAQIEFYKTDPWARGMA
jgi:hypothetical protein